MNIRTPMRSRRLLLLDVAIDGAFFAPVERTPSAARWLPDQPRGPLATWPPGRREGGDDGLETGAFGVDVEDVELPCAAQLCWTRTSRAWQAGSRCGAAVCQHRRLKGMEERKMSVESMGRLSSARPRISMGARAAVRWGRPCAPRESSCARCWCERRRRVQVQLSMPTTRRGSSLATSSARLSGADVETVAGDTGCGGTVSRRAMKARAG